ncbi:MAG: GatB/YqeY domain-containing protein [Bacteroidetes bacterium]|nr:GatB/YqeY domain-containing protein [Bacteroidota bacterium]
MSLSQQIATDLKEAMKSKDKVRLESLRSIKSAILLAQTEKGAGASLNEEEELKILTKLQKQRKDSLAIYEEQNREDLAAEERAQLAVIETFLPQALSETELEDYLKKVIAETGAESAKDMGKVMGRASKDLAGRADGKTISAKVRALLS